jgi:GT2 family glycosyltransferase
MQVSIIIVNWNSTAYVRECIRSIYEYSTDLSFEIIVVDNASPTDDVDTLRPEFPEIALIKSSHNLGFGGANNLGAAHSSGECLLFLNPDTTLVSPAIAVILECLQCRPSAGIVGCKLLNLDLTVQTSCIQRFPTILNQVLDADVLRERWPNSRLWGTAPLYCETKEAAAVEVISGACLMIKRHVFEQIGGFTEKYFMYGEDLDLCHKVIRLGYKNFYTGNATVVHYGGGSSAPQSATAMKWKAIVLYMVLNRGRGYALMFRAAMAMVAVGRLLIIGIGRRWSGNRERGGYSSYSKWKVILKTVLGYGRSNHAAFSLAKQEIRSSL